MPKQVTAADRAVGARLHALRKARGLTQTALAEVLGVSFQQVQKYERGQNRIGAGRLRTLAALLEVPISAFYGEGEEGGGALLQLLHTPHAAELLQAYGAMPAVMRTALLNVARGLTHHHPVGAEEASAAADLSRADA
jgi:transcriptional regulator with XRE-family HTH domain